MDFHDSNNLPESGFIASEILDDLQTALDQFVAFNLEEKLILSSQNSKQFYQSKFSWLKPRVLGA